MATKTRPKPDPCKCEPDTRRTPETCFEGFPHVQVCPECGETETLVIRTLIGYMSVECTTQMCRFRLSSVEEIEDVIDQWRAVLAWMESSAGPTVKADPFRGPKAVKELIDDWREFRNWLGHRVRIA